ncbi:uncharacterized protein LOC129870727 [Solanum dulcamara]|uniref:uncharacterized protein LOC129870727 n=1 Tax=Solanum dulcamara TaxID=45834 RepID=UPI002485CAC3|nr:uncharacterized protein LOC129870727 [Solanum dulcamara]
MQFLGGLNENYNQSRSQIFMIPIIPSVNEAYSMLIHEQSQRAHLNMVALTSHSQPEYEEGKSSSLAAAAIMRHGYDLKQKSILPPPYEEGESSGSGAGGDHFTRSNSNNMRIKNNSNLQCDFYHLKSHIRKNCYKLISYLSDFKFIRNKEREQNDFRGGNYHNSGYRSANRQKSGGYSAHNVNVHCHYDFEQQKNVQQPNVHSSKEQGFTIEQFKKLLNLIDKQGSLESITNMAGSLH